MLLVLKKVVLLYRFFMGKSNILKQVRDISLSERQTASAQRVGLLPLIGGRVCGFSTERRCTDASTPYDGFNITHYSGDAPEHVFSCRQQLCKQLGISDSCLIVPRQVHGCHVEEVTTSNLTSPFVDTDAIVTRLSGICIGVSTADCVPILFYDRRTKAIGAAHAGWRGTVARIGMFTLRAMSDAFGTFAGDVECVIGPSIGPDAFEVGDDVYDAFAQSGFPMSDIAFRAPETQKWHIDLWHANSWQLMQEGIPLQSIHVCGICTYANYSRFFSARRLGINSGRIFTGIIVAKSEKD